MDFKHPDGRSVAVVLPERSLLVMKGESRYLWTHGWEIGFFCFINPLYTLYAQTTKHYSHMFFDFWMLLYFIIIILLNEWFVFIIYKVYNYKFFVLGRDEHVLCVFHVSITPRKFDVVPVSEAGGSGVMTSDLSNLTLSRRDTRISLTFRKIRHTPCNCGECVKYLLMQDKHFFFFFLKLLNKMYSARLQKKLHLIFTFFLFFLSEC